LNVDASHDSCQACQDSEATHLCEDCGAVLCLDCLESTTTEYYFCTNCHRNLGDVRGNQKPEKCPDCDSDQIGVGRKIVEICPRCHSTRLILVEDRRRELAQELRKAILTLQYGHLKLREFVRHFTSARQLLVSLRMAKFLHYKWLEDQLEAIQEEIPALKNRIVSQAEIVARQMAAETKGLMDYPSWTADQFPFITGVTNRVTELGERYKLHVDETLQSVRARLDELRDHINGLDYYRREFAGFYEHSELEVNELPVCAFPRVRVTGSDFLKHDKATGTLYITNRRFIFIAKTGTLRKRTEVIFDFPLLYLNGIEEDGRFRKRLVLKLKQGDIKLSCSEQTQRVLPDYVEIAKRFDRYVQTDLQRVRRLEQHDVSATDARMRIDEMVYSLLSRDRHVSSSERAPRRIARAGWSRPIVERSPTMTVSEHDRFRTELEGILQRNEGWELGPRIGASNTETSSLRQTAQNIENEIRETIHLLRTGRIVPEDFVRRYRGLMRDSFEIRRRMEHYGSHHVGL